MISSFIASQTQSVSASSRKVGEFVFDAVISESHTSTLKITENPIESGALVADHAVVQPKELTISGIIVEYVSPELPDYQLAPGVRDTVDYLDNIIYSSSIVRKSREVLAKVNQVIDTFMPFVKLGARALAPWMLGADDNTSLFVPTSLSNDRISELHGKLLDIQKSGEFLDVQTGTRLYKNMLIAEVSLFQEKDGSATVNLILKEVIVVETKQVSGVSSGNDGSKAGAASKSGRAATQSAPMSDKGRTQPEESDDGSLLNKIKGGLF